MWIADNKPVTMPLEMISCQWGWMMCPPGDQFVTGSLRAWGVYSETESIILRKLCANRRALIIGGNIGAIAAPLSQVASYVEVYEPQPIIAKVLEANMALAGGNNYLVENAAVGPEEGTINVPVVRFDADCNMGRIGKENWGKGSEVPIHNINPILLQGEFDFMLVDAEGMELEILKSADSKLLPDLMWVECDREEEGKELIDYIKSLDYQTWWMNTPLTPNKMSPDQGPWPMQASFNLLCSRYPGTFPKELSGIPEFVATPDDAVGTCEASKLIWNI